MRAIGVSTFCIAAVVLASGIADGKPAAGEVYVCSSGETLRVYPVADWEGVVLSIDGELRVLPRSVSASGARYSDSTVVFWNKGDEAFVDVDGVRAHDSCTLLQQKSAVDPKIMTVLGLPVCSWDREDVGEFNEAVESAARAGETWPEDPLRVALAYVGNATGSVVALTQRGDSAEAPSRIVITVVREGLADDSVRGVWHELHAARAGSTWVLTDAYSAWRCWRGTQINSFGSSLCP
ncbi:MAG: MliC family protein [Candidatus Eisenbacteria bacterium]|nr:MliC family protein [Candidatus Eisenbacteria bacterium]